MLIGEAKLAESIRQGREQLSHLKLRLFRFLYSQHAVMLSCAKVDREKTIGLTRRLNRMAVDH